MRWWYGLGLVLSMAVTPLEAANVRRIVFDGFDQLPVVNAPLVNQIRQELPLKPGEPYDPAAGEKARVWLQNHGVFSKVELSERRDGQVVDLTFKVVANPVVQLVRMEGNTQISSGALRPSLQTRPKYVLNTVAVALDANVIGKAYLDNGMRVMVNAAFDPPPTSPAKPVTVTFKITELRFGPLTIEPLRYVKQAALQPYLVLQQGELLTEARIQEQRKKLYQTGLFQFVSPADDPQAPTDQGLQPLTFHVDEAEYPLITQATLPLVDLPSLARTVRFSAVEVPVERRDFYIFMTPQETAAALQAARTAAGAGDAAAAYQFFALLHHTGQDAKAAAKAAKIALQGQTDAVSRVHLARVLWYLDEDAQAIELASGCTSDPATQWSAWELLLDARMANLSREDKAATTTLSTTLQDGLAALAEATAVPAIDGLTSAYRFYYTALTLALIKPELKLTVALDSPASHTLINWVIALDKAEPPLSAAEARHVGRMLVAAGFAAYATGGEAAPPQVWQHYQQLLKLAREQLLTAGLAGCGDPAAYYFTALCDLLRDDTPSARAIALQGLAEHPTNERLVDAYILACVQARTQGDTAKTIDILKESISDVQKKVATPAYGTWGGLLLLAKLHMALRDSLPETDTVARDQARTAAEAAARNAVTIDGNQISGWWMLGLTQIKGRNPASAAAAYQQVHAMNDSYREIKYAMALLKLVTGDTAGGLAAMQALAPPARP